jgi:threonine dehydratase
MHPNFDDIKNAATRINPFIHHTPVLTSSVLNAITQANLFFKCENFQKAGAFKIRGATNAVLSLTERQAEKGVATHSSGNHGAALALAAKRRGIPAYIVMPTNSPEVKKRAVAAYGAEITYCEPGLAGREATVEKVIAKTGATFIHPYNNEWVIAGQGTVGYEFFQEKNSLDILIVPVGGGGLIAGVSLAGRAFSPQTKIIGAEPKGADDAYRSFKAKKLLSIPAPQTFCDGLATSVMGSIPFPIILENVHAIFTASEETIINALQLIWERMKIIVEPSAAVSLAIILENPDFFKDKNVGLILSGGNVDIKAIATRFS